MEKVNKKKPKRFNDVLKTFKDALHKDNPNGIKLVHTAWVNNLMDRLEEAAEEEYKRGIIAGLDLAQGIMNTNLEVFIQDVKKGNGYA